MIRKDNTPKSDEIGALNSYSSINVVTDTSEPHEKPRLGQWRHLKIMSGWWQKAFWPDTVNQVKRLRTSVACEDGEEHTNRSSLRKTETTNKVYGLTLVLWVKPAVSIRLRQTESKDEWAEHVRPSDPESTLRDQHSTAYLLIPLAHQPTNQPSHTQTHMQAAVQCPPMYQAMRSDESIRNAEGQNVARSDFQEGG